MREQGELFGIVPNATKTPTGAYRELPLSDDVTPGCRDCRNLVQEKEWARIPFDISYRCKLSRQAVHADYGTCGKYEKEYAR